MLRRGVQQFTKVLSEARGMPAKFVVPSFSVDRPEIVLNETESKVTKLVRDFISSYNADARARGVTDESKLLVSRITGGWVRDKLLGNESDDLDIAINSMAGEQFAELLMEYLKQHRDHYDSQLHSIHKIEKNPEKSKHLETATTKLFGLDIDFVNLRSEEYTEESRIPTIDFGTPEQDALRRDATLNALFYNIQTGEVEDLTGRGLRDLQAGVLRTPLAPLKTFLDDPLRVLRLIRFAARFNFSLDPETFDAMRSPLIKSSLLTKISRERVGIELEKIFKTANPTYGIELIEQTQLMDSIFNFGSYQETVEKLNEGLLPVIAKIQHEVNVRAPRVVSTLSSLTVDDSEVSSILLNSFSKEHTKLIWLSLLLQPWKDTRVKISTTKKTAPFALEMIVKEGIKFPKADGDVVIDIILQLDKFPGIVKRVGELKRSELGLFLREFGQYHQLAMVTSLLNELVGAGASPAAVEQVFSDYNRFNNRVTELNLEQVHLVKPIINGKDICKKLGTKPGPWMKEILQSILVWQLDNPTLGEEDCFEFVKPLIK